MGNATYTGKDSICSTFKCSACGKGDKFIVMLGLAYTGSMVRNLTYYKCEICGHTLIDDQFDETVKEAMKTWRNSAKS